MKKIFLPVIIILIIIVLGFLGWQFLLKKSGEGESCKTDKNCQEGLKCVTDICSSQKAGSPCLGKEDCLTGFCVNNKCTEGKEGDACNASQDCQEISLCKNSSCVRISEKPDETTYAEYFSDIGLGKLPTGGKLPFDLQENIDVFNREDQICLYGTLNKGAQVGTAVYDSKSKKYAIEKTLYPRFLEKGGFAGCGPVDLSAGKYEYKAYIGDTLVALIPFEVR